MACNNCRNSNQNLNNNCSDTNTIKAGRISGNPCTGLCDRIAVEVNQVFDGCRSEIVEKTFILKISNLQPADLVPPYTFISATNSGTATLTNIVVTPIVGRRTKFEADILIPLTVNLSDVNGNVGTASSAVSIHYSTILNVPELAIMPYEFSVSAVFESDTGTFINEDTINVVCCTVIIAKIIVKRDIVIPAYGNAVYPVCDSAPDACSRIIATQLFPPLNND